MTTLRTLTRRSGRLTSTSLSRFWRIGDNADPSVPNLPLDWDAAPLPPFVDDNLIQFVGRKIVPIAGATSGDTTIDLSSGLEGGIDTAVQPGDIVIAAFGTGSTADRTLSITDGTTAYPNSFELYSDDTYDTNLRYAFKEMGAIPDTSVVFGPTGSANDAGTVAVYVLRGVDPATITASAGTSINTTNPGASGLTPALPGERVVSIAVGASATATAYNTPSDLLNFEAKVQADTNSVVMGIGITGPLWSPVTLESWTGGSATSSDSYARVIITLKPRGVAEITSGGTWSHNGIYSGLYGGTGGAGMRNGTNNTYEVYGSDGASGEFLKWDLGEPRKIIGARIACIDDDPGIWGGPWGAAYTNSRLLQWSDDDSAWNTEVTLSGYVDGTDEFLNWDIDPTTAHRYWRIYIATGFVGVGEFRLYEYDTSFSVAAASASHAHTASSPTIGAANAVTPADATHGHSSTQPSIASAASIVPNDAAHGHTADSPAMAAGATAITSDDCTHSHTASSPVISTAYTLAVADASHGHTASQSVIGSAADIAPANAAHGHTAEGPALAAANTLAPDNAAHDHTSTSPTIDAANAIAPASALHDHSASSPAIASAASLVPANAAHAHEATSPTVASAASVTAADALHDHAATSPSISAANAIVPADAAHDHAASQPSITASGTAITVADANHGHSATSPSLSAANAVSPANADHAHSANSPTIAASASLSVDSAAHGHTAAQPSIGAANALTPADANHDHAATQPSLGAANAITPANALHGHDATSPSVASLAALAISDAAHAHSASSPSVAFSIALAPDMATHGHSATSPTLAFLAGIAANDNVHGHSATSPSMSAQFALVANDAFHLHDATSPTITRVISPSERRNRSGYDWPRNGATPPANRIGYVEGPARNRASSVTPRNVATVRTAR